MDQHSTRSEARAGTLPGVVDTPSPPTERELEILHRVLGASRVDGAARLRDQVRMVQVVAGSDATCRIYLVHPDAPRSGFASDGRSKLDSLPVRSPHGRVVGEIAVWVEYGHLRALQYIEHDSRAAITLPPADWIQLPEPNIPAAARLVGALQSLAGHRALGAAPVRAIEVRPADEPAVSSMRPERSPRARRAGKLAFALCVMALAVAALVAGRAYSADVDAARAEATADGTRDGAAHGTVSGTFMGATDGLLAGRASTYETARTAAIAKRAAAVRRRAAVRRQRAAAVRERRLAAQAAAAEVVPAYSGYVGYSSCAGYRDSYGNWICS